MARKSKIEPIAFKLSDRIKARQLIYPGLFAIAFLALSLILSWKFFPTHTLTEGVIAPREITANRNFQVEDSQATNEARIKAMNSVNPVYSVDPYFLSKLDEKMKLQFNIFSQIHKFRTLNQQEKIRELKNQLPVQISDESLRVFTDTDQETLDQLEIASVNLITGIMKYPIPDGDEAALKEARKSAVKAAKELTLSPLHRTAVAELASESIQANARVDWDETYRQRQLKKDQVQPVYTTIQQGQVIVEKGKIVTPQQIDILEEMGLQRSQFNLSAVTGTLIFVFLSILVAWLYIKQFMPELAGDPKLLLLLIIVLVGTTLLCRMLMEVNPFWAPVPVATILITVLINPRIAWLTTAYLSIMLGIFTLNPGGENTYQFIGVSLVTGSVSVLFAARVQRRLDLVIASVLIFLINITSITMFSLIKGDSARVMMESLFYGGINGFGSGVLALGLMPVLEHMFGVTTGIRLLELSNQSEPLLKRLLLEAPGTYHHSVIVGNLAEAAAEAVGENPLLCRVGAYYHDIGKLRRPYFFIENQLGAENPHDKLSPNLSALIILSHVKDGLEMAKQYKIPEPIKDIILQHHGSSIIAYFYHQAKQSDKEFPLEDDFRYPGPKPGTKAAAIVMLADSIEAAARTLQKPTPTKIEMLVKQIIRNNLDDGQLDESPLSLRDLNEIARTFTRILTGIYHQRIEYPEKIIEEMGPAGTPMVSKVTPLKEHMM
ncbi:MAG: HDIG domain-containing protein [Firmicutes bacterium]|nr:HDIG domain-containing protein [Bacillota bacterium]